MNQKLGNITLIIPDYDEARNYFTNILGFDLLDDTDLGGGKRWLIVKPKGTSGAGIVLAKAITEEEKQAIGKQGADRVWLFLHTDDFYRDHTLYSKNGVNFLEAPREEIYGTVAVFQDRYGNKWDLLELKPSQLGQ